MMSQSNLNCNVFHNKIAVSNPLHNQMVRNLSNVNQNVRLINTPRVTMPIVINNSIARPMGPMQHMQPNAIHNNTNNNYSINGQAKINPTPIIIFNNPATLSNNIANLNNVNQIQMQQQQQKQQRIRQLQLQLEQEMQLKLKLQAQALLQAQQKPPMQAQLKLFHNNKLKEW